MERPVLSVIVTAHDEGYIAGPTMRSVEDAIARAEALGYEIERLAGLDNPSEETLAFFAQPRLARWTITRMEFKDPFPARNHMVSVSRGKFIAFVDGDDMVSENWFLKGIKRLEQAEASGERVIVHPELNWIFDGASSVFSKIEQDSPIFCGHYFYTDNYYDMMAVYPREAVLDTPYGQRDLSMGYGFQDWQWNLETIMAGWKHVVELDTVIFKRRRPHSVSEVNRSRSAVCRFIDCMAIDNVRTMKSKYLASEGNTAR